MEENTFFINKDVNRYNKKSIDLRGGLPVIEDEENEYGEKNTRKQKSSILK